MFRGLSQIYILLRDRRRHKCIEPMANATPSRLGDLTAPLPNPSTRKDTPAANTKRRQTLLSLLDALHELSQDDDRTYGKLLATWRLT